MQQILKRSTAALAVAALLVLAGCQLARPDGADTEAGQSDRFAGFYVVYAGENENPFQGLALTEYGQDTLDGGKYGVISLPRQVLFAQYDEQTHRFSFPGLTGFALFVSLEDMGDGSPCICSNSDMPDSDFHTTINDEGTSYDISGTIYFGAPLGAPADWDSYESGQLWHFYRVFQTAEGLVYLDGSGNSTNGGAGSSFSERASNSTTIDGETTTEALSVKVTLAQAGRLERLTVYQFGEDAAPLDAAQQPIQSDIPPVRRAAGAVWVLVEELYADGTAKRTAYTLPAPGEEPVSHAFILLDAAGLGTGGMLTIE